MPNRIHKLLTRFVDIKPEEVHISVLLFFFFFLITAPHTIIKALRYADLLENIGFQVGLPKAYFFTALVSGIVVFLHSKIQFKVSLQGLITTSLVFFMVTGLFFLLFMGSLYTPSISYMYWIWGSILVVVLMTHFGLTFNEIFNIQETKRLIGFCGSGGILGGTFGGLIGHLLIKVGLGKALLPLACGLLFICIFVARAIFSLHEKRQISSQDPQKKPKQTEEVGFKDSFNAVRKNRLLIFIALMVVLSLIVSTFIDYQFSSIVQDRYDSQIEKQSFLTLFFGLVTLAAFFFQIFLTSNLLKRTKGIFLALLLAPLVLMIGSLGILIGSISLLSVIIVKSSDEGLTFSLTQSVRNILYIPLSVDLRSRARPFIQMFVNQVAKVIAAGLLFLYGLYLNIIKDDTFTQKYTLIENPNVAEDLSWGIIFFTLLWILVNFRIFRHYVGTIKQKVGRKWNRIDKDIAGKIDIHFAKQIFDTLESRERSPSLYAMHLFELLERGQLTPEIRKMISQKKEGVNISYTQNLFNAEGASWFPQVEDDFELDSFVSDIKEILALEDYQKLVGAQAEKEREQGKETEIKRMELAKAIGMMDPNAPLVKKLKNLIADDSPQVARYAIESAAKLQKEEHIPAVIEKLGLPQIREDAVSALLKYGSPAQRELGMQLKKKSTNIELKKVIIAVLARMGTQESADNLLNELDLDTNTITTNLVEALDQIRSERPQVRFSESISQRKTYALVNKYCRTFLELNSPDTKKNEKLRKSLQRTLDLYFTNIFKLLGLYHPHDDIVRAYQNFKTGKKDSKDYAVELLDNTLKKDIREIILSLILDISSAARIQKFQQMLEKFPEF